MRFVPVRFFGINLFLWRPFLWTNITCYSNSLIFGQVADHATPYMGGIPPLVNGCLASRAYKLSFLLLALQRCILFALHTFYFCVRPFCMPCALSGPFRRLLLLAKPWEFLTINVSIRYHSGLNNLNPAQRSFVQSCEL